jgi:hypothetical protein
MSSLLTLPVSIRLGWKQLTITNTNIAGKVVAYLSGAPYGTPH